MSMADKPRRVTITTQGSLATVVVDGTDLSKAIKGYQIEHTSGQMPAVVLLASSDASDLFDGLATVGVAVQQQPGEAVVAFLSAIDPAALERAALDRNDLVGGKHELTVAMLQTLAEWFQGKVN